MAMFDSRVFNIPKEEVANCLLWRQLDAERNSILSVAQANYSQKEMQGISCKELVAKLENEKGIIWGNLPTSQKRGICCIKEITYTLDDGQVAKNNSNTSVGEKLEVKEHSKWKLDFDIPRFNENREYIEDLINVGE